MFGNGNLIEPVSDQCNGLFAEGAPGSMFLLNVYNNINLEHTGWVTPATFDTYDMTSGQPQRVKRMSKKWPVRQISDMAIWN